MQGRDKEKVVARIYSIIEEIEKQLEEVKVLLELATTEEESDDAIFVDAEFVDKVLHKPKPKSKKELRAEGRALAQVWAKTELKCTRKEKKQS
jgi:hypothetical protein